MSIPASLVDSTITNNKPDDRTAFSCFILQIDSLTVFKLLAAVASDESFLFHANPTLKTLSW